MADSITDRARFDEELRQLEVQALNFATRFINDANVRRDYQRQVGRYSNELRAAVNQGQMSARQAAEAAQQMRNQIMEVARLRSSDIGRAAARGLKPEGVGLTQLCERYAQRLFQRPFSALTDAQRNQVFLEIVEASGRTRPSVNAATLRMARLGRGLIVVSVGIAVYNIATAEDRVDAAAREGAVAGGGILGGIAGGAAAGALFGAATGPGAVVAVPVGVFVGGVLGALGADFAYGWFSGR